MSRKEFTSQEMNIAIYLKHIEGLKEPVAAEGENTLLVYMLGQILDFLAAEDTLEKHTRDTVIQIYRKILAANERCSVFAAFEPHTMEFLVHYNLACCFHKTADVKQTLEEIIDAVIHYDAFLADLAARQDPRSLFALKKRFIRVYLQAAALFSFIEDYPQAIKIGYTAIHHLRQVITDFRRIVHGLSIQQYDAVIDDLEATLLETASHPKPEATERKKLSSTKLPVYAQALDGQKMHCSVSTAASSSSNFKLSPKLLEFISVKNVVSASFISRSLFEDTVLPPNEVSDALIELILLTGVCFFTLANEKRYLGMAECRQPRPKADAGYGKRFLDELNAERALLANPSYVER